MASVKIVLRKKKYKDGSYPLALRITHNRHSSYIYLSKNIHLSQWDQDKHIVRNTHPNSKRLNNFLLSKTAQVNNILLELETNNRSINIQEIKREIMDKKQITSFFSYAENYFSTLKLAQNYNRYTSEQPAINHFKRYLNNRNIKFHEISISLLEGFKAYLQGEIKVANRTVFNYLVVIRTIYRKATKEGFVEQDFYPFGKDKFRVKRPESLKIGLEKEEVKKLEEIKLPQDSFAHHARNVWLFSFYFAGMRASDVLLTRWSDFKGERLYYVMEKNQKPGSLKIPDKAKAIISQYTKNRKTKDDLLFPDLKSITDFKNKESVQRRIKEAIKRINNSLKELAIEAKIDKKLTMHIARHTFGNISGDKIPIHMLQKLYRHSSITTTVNYQKNFLFKEVDDALDAVIN